jgi:hypothetical protein
MKNRPYRYAVAGQLSLLVFLSVCVALHPGLVLKWNEAGLSNYGIHVKTVVPYSLALGGCSILSFMSARSLSSSARLASAMRLLLVVYGGLMMMSLLSTYVYKLNAALRMLHIVCGITTILFGFGASLWMFLMLRSTSRDTVWLCVQLAGFALAVIDYFNVLHVLFLAQAMTAVGFGFLLARAVRRTTSH